ncbi:hypothetical protein J3E69DRAFT_347859 [Trichoderma sp. SZMC 28015]
MMPAHAKICPSTRLTTGCYCTSRRERFELDAGVDTAASDLSGRNVDGPNTCPANSPRRFRILETLKLQTFKLGLQYNPSRLSGLAARAASAFRPYYLPRQRPTVGSASKDLLQTTAQHQIHRANEKQATGSSSKTLPACQIMAQLLVIDGQNSPQGEPNARAHPQHALRTLACLTTMHVSGPKHSPHVRPQCGARLEISGHVST